MLLTAGVGLGIAAWMAAHGFWPVVPFAGLELSALAAAVYVSVKRNAYREVLVFEPQELRIESGMLGRGAASVIQLSRSMTRVMLEQGEHRNDPNRLVLSCAGQRVRVARCLTDEERVRLAARIKELLTPAWCRDAGQLGGKSGYQVSLGE